MVLAPGQRSPPIASCKPTGPDTVDPTFAKLSMMSRSIAAVLLLTLAVTAQTEIYSNGPFTSHPNGGPFNAPRSQLQLLTGPLLNLVGIGVTGTGWSVADNFAVPNVMLIDEIEVFGFASPMMTPPTPLAEFELCIWDGNPSTGTPNQKLPSAGIGVNLATTTGFTVTSSATGVYRVSDANPVIQMRPIESIRVTLPSQLVLTTGDYWLGWRAKTAIGTGGFFAIPLTTVNVGPTGDALQLTTSWSPVTSGSIFGPVQHPQGLPFKFYGTPAVPPGAIQNVGGGCSSATLIVAGSPVPGGYFHAELENSTGLAGIAFTSGPPSVPVPGCSCHAGTGLLTIAAGIDVTFELPLTPSLFGAKVYAQGLQLHAAAVCSLPGALTLDLTDAYQFRL